MSDWVHYQIWGDVTKLATKDLIVGLNHWKSQLQASPGGHVFAERVSLYERELEKRMAERSLETRIESLEDEVTSNHEETLESLQQIKRRLRIKD